MSFLTKRIHFQHIINNITSFVVLSTQKYVLLSFFKKKKKKNLFLAMNDTSIPAIFPTIRHHTLGCFW